MAEWPSSEQVAIHAGVGGTSSSRSQGASLEGAPVLLLFVDLPFTAIAYTWVFQHTRGSVFVAAAFHAALNLWTIPMPQSGAEPLAPYLFGLGSRVAVAWALVAVLGSGLTRARVGQHVPTSAAREPLSPMP
jgi:uncharacterized protein